jgi:hypothetical protein
MYFNDLGRLFYIGPSNLIHSQVLLVGEDLNEDKVVGGKEEGEISRG